MREACLDAGLVEWGHDRRYRWYPERDYDTLVEWDMRYRCLSIPHLDEGGMS